jgi:hypothetical protein
MAETGKKSEEPADGFPERSVGVTARIEPEAGHWVVFLDVSFWNEDSTDSPLNTVSRRITTYPTLERAKIAANFMVRAAARDLPHPPLGS